MYPPVVLLQKIFVSPYIVGMGNSIIMAELFNVIY